MRHEGSSVNQYAQHVISSPGTQDGLAWQNPDGTWAGPVGENVAKAIAQGYTEKPLPYHGYFFKVLKGQGPAAPLGEMDFVVKGAMIGGFALVAAPAEYLVTGVKTFIVSHDGVVYEKDLGTKTFGAFVAMERFNPDKTWTAWWTSSSEAAWAFRQVRRDHATRVHLHAALYSADPSTRPDHVRPPSSAPGHGLQSLHGLRRGAGLGESRDGQRPQGPRQPPKPPWSKGRGARSLC